MTIRDVARRAGVSVTTVSKALNEYPDVNESTRARIYDIAREMGYTANPIASTLVRKSSSMIGFVMSSWVRESGTGFMNEILSGVYEGIQAEGYEVMILPVDTQNQRKRSFSRLIREYHLAGVIVQGLRTDDPYRPYRRNGTGLGFIGETGRISYRP